MRTLGVMATWAGFAVAAVLFVSMLSYSARLIAHGAAQPDLATGQVEAIRNKGATVYVTHDQVARLYVLVGASLATSVVSTGLLLALRRRR